MTVGAPKLSHQSIIGSLIVLHIAVLPDEGIVVVLNLATSLETWSE